MQYLVLSLTGTMNMYMYRMHSLLLVKCILITYHCLNFYAVDVVDVKIYLNHSRSIWKEYRHFIFGIKLRNIHS